MLIGGDEMASKEEMFKEFDIIQEIIERQANNSFRIKGWTIALVVVALVFRNHDFQLLVAFIPLLGFWGLDAYFLCQEKRYRNLYDWVRENRLDTDKYLFDLDTSRISNQVDGTLRTMISPTLIGFYGSIGVLLILYTVIVVSMNGGIALG